MAISVLSVAQKLPYIIKGYKPKAISYSIDRGYIERSRNDYLRKFGVNQALYDAVIKEFKSVWEEKLGGKLLRHEELDKNDVVLYTTRKDLILSYLAHKSFKICATYDDYFDLFDTNGLLANANNGFVNTDSYDSFIKNRHQRFEDVVALLDNPQYDSHINLKIRQCLCFMNSFQYNEERGRHEISDLVAGKTIDSFDDAVLLLPPAFFNADLVLEKDDGSGEEITISRMSSGERQLLYSLSYILYHLKNIQSVKQTENCHQYHHINLVFDEAELYYHPDYQRIFVKQLIEYISRCNLNPRIIKSINVIIATHSPFVLSDILTGNTLYLEEGNPKSVLDQTFGANYYDMFHNSFFFKNTALGEVSTRRIREWLEQKNRTYNQKERFALDEILPLIGDPLIVNYLFSNFQVNNVQNKNRPE